MADTELLTVVKGGDIGAVIALLDAAAETVDLNVTNKDGDTALILAVEAEHAEIVAALIDVPGKDGAAVDLNVVDTGGMTPLMIATSKNHAQIVTMLLGARGKNGAAVDLNMVNVHGNTALICAAYKGNAEIVRAQLGAPGKDDVAVDLNVVNMEGNTALISAVNNGCVLVVNTLLNATGINGAAVDLNVTNMDGCSALIVAAFHNNYEIVASLLGATGKDGVAVDLNIMSKGGQTALILAVEHDNVAIVDALVRATGKDGVPVDLNVRHGPVAALHNPPHGEPTVLILAAYAGHADIVTALLDAPCSEQNLIDINTISGNGNSALVCAVKKSHYAVVTALLGTTGKYAGAINLNSRAADGGTALTWAVATGCAEICIALLSATGMGGVGADINATVEGEEGSPLERGDSSLILAAKDGNIEILNALLHATGKDGAAIDLNYANFAGNTACIMAAYTGHAKNVTALLHATGKDGAAVDINLANEDGNTALFCALYQRHDAVVHVLLARNDGADVDLNTVNNDGRTPLMQAIVNGNLSIVSALVDGKSGNAANINLAGYRGSHTWTPLGEALESQNVDVVKLLVDRRVDVCESDYAYAFKYCNHTIVRKLEQSMPKKVCAACKVDKVYVLFANAQLKKSSAERRCADCVQNGKRTPTTKAASEDVVVLQCSSCALSKAPAQFSKAQRGKKDARKCIECVIQAGAMEQEAKAAAAAAKLLEAEAASSAKAGPVPSSRHGRKKGTKEASGSSAGKARMDSSRPPNLEMMELQITQASERRAVEREEQAREAAKEAARAAIREAEWQATEITKSAASPPSPPKSDNAAGAFVGGAPGATALPPRLAGGSPMKTGKTANVGNNAKVPGSAVYLFNGIHTVTQDHEQPASTPKQPALQPRLQSAQHQLPATSPPATAAATAAAGPTLATLQPSTPASIPPLLELDPSCLTAAANNVLGCGSFATVIGGTYNFPVHGDVPVAIKVFHGTAGDRVGRGEAAALTELVASTRVSVNQHLVQMYGAARLHTHGLCLVMEKITGQSMRVVLDETAEILSWGLRIRWLYEIAQGMDVMHQQKPNPVLHRDLKASNVLLDSINVRHARAKIADFGVAKAIDTLVVDTYSRGSREWSAPEALLGFMSFPTDVYSYGIVIFEVLTRLLPFSNKSSGEKTRMEVLQVECAKFEYDAEVYNEEGVDEEQQRARWARKRARTLKKRRPDLDLVGGECPADAVVMMQECWRDEPADRPLFTHIVATFAPGGNSGGGGSNPGTDAKKEPAPQLSIYTICGDELRKASVELAEDGLSRERASEIFTRSLAGTLEKLFKAIVTQHKLPMPAGKAPGLGTYYRVLRDVQGSGSDAVFVASSVQAMDKLCSQRNQVVHEDAQYSVPTIRQHALTCIKVLDAVQRVYAM